MATRSMIPWTEGQHYLLQWDVTGVVSTSAGPRQTRVRGEAVLFTRGEHEKTRGLYLERFGIAASGVEARRAHTGVITVRGYSSSGSIEIGRASHAARVEVVCDVNYESLDRAHRKELDKGCYYIPATEPAAAIIEGRLTLRRKQLQFDTCRIHVSCAAGESEEVVAIEVLLRNGVLKPLPERDVHYRFGRNGEWAPSQDSNSDSNVCIGTTRRRLVIQPVGFRSSATDPSPSGGTAAAQFATAQTVWSKACIDLDVRSMLTLTNATLKTSSNLTDIRNGHTDSDPNVIEIFFVDNPLSATGGGNAGAIGVASCKPVIAEPNAGNPVLLAHELGHVLNLLHPGTGSNSDPGTVMAPTGSAMAPGTQLVTHIMCASIANPVLQATTTSCCFTHDIPNHYLRDFPTDLGNEPSEPLPAGVNRYAMSNVWNRLTNTPGTMSALTGPEHQNPIRFNADMTPRTNYLFARVEQLVNLPVRDARVRFFLKNPGSGGGASNLTLLGEAVVPGSLGVGIPQNVSLAWTVPMGVPKHSCIFAVVRSDAEPEGDQSSLDWWQFETLSRNDNDWAQRNLDIENMSSSNEDSNTYESAPSFIFLPPLRQRPSPTLTLRIDATRAKGLKSLRLQVLEGKSYDLSPGGRQSIRLDIRKARERIALVLHAEVPRRLKVGTSYVIGVDPAIGERALIGYAVDFRASSRHDLMVQIFDDALASLGDFSELADAPGIRALYRVLARRMDDRPYSQRELADRLTGARKDIDNLVAELDAVKEARDLGAPETAQQLLTTLDDYRGESVSERAVVQRFRALCARCMMAASLLARYERET